MPPAKPVKAIVIGAGCRGRNYSAIANDFPDKLKMVAVADPKKFNRDKIQKRYNIPDSMTFDAWEPVADMDKFADCVFICTPDRHHKDPAVAFAKKGYHILLEKPMGVSYSECKEIVDACKENNVMLQVCHVLRYTPQARKIKDLIDSGRIGEVVNIQLIEPVGFWHFAHSYVRGNWHNEAKSSFSLLAKSCHDIDLIGLWMGKQKCTAISSFGSLKHFRKENKVGFWHFAHSFVRGNWCKSSTSTFSLLAKSCHDLDLIQYFMGKQPCIRVSSFGSLKHFRKENKPEGASSRCLDCKVERSCPYSAKKTYLNSGTKGWPVSVICDKVPDIENITEALKTGPYGKCVYESDNDVMDNQVVTMQYEGGSTVTFSMVAFTEKICVRRVRIYGTMGEIECDFDTSNVREYNFVTEDRIIHDLREEEAKANNSSLRGHGGADFHAMVAFLEAIESGDPNRILTGPDETLNSHYLCFVAEKARRENTVLNPQQIHHQVD